jgi:hypothetical protein
MSRNVIVFEGATLEEARKKLFNESPRGLFLQSETDITPMTKTVTAVADSAEGAFTAALAQQPEGMSVISRKETASAQRMTVRVDAWDEKKAAELMLKQAGPNAVVESWTELQAPKAGFIGFGKAPGKYEGVVFRKASVEVKFGRPARIEATFGARISNWAGLIHHLFTPGVKIIDELYERLGYQILFIFHERELAPIYYDGIPFSRVSAQTVEKARSLVNMTIMPGMLGMMVDLLGGSLATDRYSVRRDGQTVRKTNAVSDSAIVSVASCLPRGNVNALSNDLGRLAFRAIEHYAKLPLVRYFLSLPFSQETLGKGTFSLEASFDWQKYLAQIYSGTEALLLEIYDRLPEGGLITDHLVVKTVGGFFEKA